MPAEAAAPPAPATLDPPTAASSPADTQAAISAFAGAAPSTVLGDVSTIAARLIATANPTPQTPLPHLPAAQLNAAMVTIAREAGRTASMTVQLNPADLGAVTVRIERQPSGTTHIAVTAEKASTLLALQRDQTQLHHGLDRAGFAAAGRTIAFHVEPARSPGSTPRTDTGTTSARWGGSQGDSAGGAAGGRQNGTSRGTAAWSAGTGASPSAHALDPATPTRINLGGVNIMA